MCNYKKSNEKIINPKQIESYIYECGKCNSKIKSSYKYCPECGYKINWEGLRQELLKKIKTV